MNGPKFATPLLKPHIPTGSTHPFSQASQPLLHLQNTTRTSDPRQGDAHMTRWFQQRQVPCLQVTTLGTELPGFKGERLNSLVSSTRPCGPSILNSLVYEFQHLFFKSGFIRVYHHPKTVTTVFSMVACPRTSGVSYQSTKMKFIFPSTCSMGFLGSRKSFFIKIFILFPSVSHTVGPTPTKTPSSFCSPIFVQ